MMNRDRELTEAEIAKRLEAKERKERRKRLLRRAHTRPPRFRRTRKLAGILRVLSRRAIQRAVHGRVPPDAGQGTSTKEFVIPPPPVRPSQIQTYQDGLAEGAEGGPILPIQDRPPVEQEMAVIGMGELRRRPAADKVTIVEEQQV